MAGRGKLPYRKNPYQVAAFTQATVALATEAANAVAATITLKGPNGQALTASAAITAYLSDVSTGIGVAATAPDGGVAVGASGAVIPLVTGKVFLLVSTTAGVCTLTLTESTAKTFYLVLVFPDGSITRTAVAFAA